MEHGGQKPSPCKMEIALWSLALETSVASPQDVGQPRGFGDIEPKSGEGCSQRVDLGAIWREVPAEAWGECRNAMQRDRGRTLGNSWPGGQKKGSCWGVGWVMRACPAPGT